MAEVRTSVIVPAHNACGFLPECLAALSGEASSGTALEIIVVDDRSTDRTAEVARSFGAKVLQTARNGGPAGARNLGAREARGRYLFFVDADVRLHPGGVARAANFLDEDSSVDAVFGSYDAQPRVKGTLTEYKNLLHHFVHQHGNREASTFWSGCGAIRRSVFLGVGGFDEAGYPRCIEDIELGYRLRAAGHRIVLDRNLLCMHLKRWTLRSWIHADVFCRAIPWVRLNLARGVTPDDLNIRFSQRLSVLLVGVALAALVSSLFEPWSLAVTLLASLTAIGINWRLFRFFSRTGGPIFALRCMPLHLLYFLYSGLSFVYVSAAHSLGLRIRDGNGLPAWEIGE